MKYLTILRHAKSSWDDPTQGDLDRPLNDRGQKAIPLIGNFLKKKGIHPQLILSSPATRALDTAIGIAKILNYPKAAIKVNRKIYEGDVQIILGILTNSSNEIHEVFLFGHEPILSGLIYQLSGEALAKFPTCSAYRIAFNIQKWEQLFSKKGKCEFFVYPKQLKAE